MNQEKAREFFSAYFEGTLERGLKQTFEQRLKSDSQIQAEYQSFQRTMQELDSLKFEEIEVPLYLSDRIATRLEAVRDSKKASPWTLWLPRFGFAAVALLAIVGAGVSVFGHGNRAATSSFVDADDPSAPSHINWPSEAITIVPRVHDVKVHYSSASARNVQICDDKGAVEKTFSLNPNQSLVTTLNNGNEHAAIMEVKVSENGPDDLIVIPGSTKLETSTQTGSVREFASALSDRFQAPVVIEQQGATKVDGAPADPAKTDLSKTVSWSLDGADSPKAVAQKVLDGTGYHVSLSDSGVLMITGS